MDRLNLLAEVEMLSVVLFLVCYSLTVFSLFHLSPEAMLHPEVMLKYVRRFVASLFLRQSR